MAKFAFLFKRNVAMIGFVLITLAVLAVGVATYYLPARQLEDEVWVSHSQRVIDQLQTLESHIAMFDRKSSIPADPQRHMMMDIAHIKAMTIENPRQQRRVALLHDKLQAHAAASVVLEEIRDMLREEQRMLGMRTRAWHEGVFRTRLVLAASVTLLYSLILISYRTLYRETILRRHLLDAQRVSTAHQRELAERLSRVVEIQRELATGRSNFEELMQTITERTQNAIHGDGGVVEMLEGDEMVYRAVSGNLVPFIGTRIKAQGSISGLCVQKREVMLCNDSEEDERVDRPTCRRLGLRSMIVVPLIHKDHPVGVLKISSSSPNRFRTQDMGTLTMMATALSATLGNEEATRALQETNAVLESLATTDGLTGLKNSRFFKERLTEEFSRARRYKLPLSVVMIDVDQFKQFNDTFGHVAGDNVLKEVGALLNRTGRLSDCVARYGGEEFAVILPQTDAEGATIIAEHIREVIAGNLWAQRPITVSVGVSTLTDKTEEPGDLVKTADQALYLSKAAGRNCVTHVDAACPVSSRVAKSA